MTDRKSLLEVPTARMGQEGAVVMSERISFTHDELRLLWHLVGEAREGWDEDAEDEEIEVADKITQKVGRAFAKARRKRRG